MVHEPNQNRYRGDDVEDAFVGQPRARAGKSAAQASPRQPPMPQVRPAHPLPSVRSDRLDYDRYLQRSTDRFKIFSAEADRRRKRVIATAVAVAAVVVLIVAWAIASQTA